MTKTTSPLRRRRHRRGLSPSHLLVLILLSVIIFHDPTPITDAFIVTTKTNTKHHNIQQQSLIIQRRNPSHLLPPRPSIAHYKNILRYPSTTTTTTTTSLSLTPLSSILQISPSTAETLAGPFFGLSLFPYLLFLYFLQYPPNNTPKGVTVGFATCLLFVFLTIPAAIVAKVVYGVSLADCDYLHGSAESLLTVTNLVTVVAFRQALGAFGDDDQPKSVTSYAPMVRLVGLLTVVAGMTAVLPGVWESSGGSLIPTEVHTPYLGGFMDVPKSVVFWGREEPENALTVACWIIHVSSLVEFLVAMGFVWRWADVTSNPKWKGLTWGLLPLHSSGITACTYHLFYNRLPFMVPLQALLTCIGNTTAAYAAYRIAVSYGWKMPSVADAAADVEDDEVRTATIGTDRAVEITTTTTTIKEESKSLIGFEDLGDALKNDNDYTFLFKLFAGCAVASYVIKYGEILFNFPYVGDDVVVNGDNAGLLALAIVFVPSGLNAFKWYKRSLDPTFEGWF